MHKTIAILLGAACTALLCILASAPSQARAAFATGFMGGEYLSGDPSVRDVWLDRTVATGARVVRIGLSWRDVAPSPPGDPSDPADPAYRFMAHDAAIEDVTERGLQPLLTVTDAPSFAEGPNRPAAVRAGAWKPDPDAVEAFGRALAGRYSGSLAGLPRVRYFQLWNEPNLPFYLSPQWAGKRPVGARRYRRMLNAFHAGVKAVRTDNVVITGGTAPYGDPPGKDRTRPLAFWREVLCLRRKRGRLLRKKCRPKPRFDVLAHHPINTSGPPRRPAFHRDDVSSADLGRLRTTLRAAERLRTISGSRRRHAIWATEIWWESNPPDTVRGVRLARHARYLEETLYLLWKAGAKVVVNLLIRDEPYDPNSPRATTQAGVYFADGTPKPALQAYRFPFVTERRSKRMIRAWGKAPVSGRLLIERRRGGRWRRVASKRVRAGRVFVVPVRLSGGARLRARVGAEASLVWRQRG